METILCPTDFSQAADNAVNYADELAHRMKARLILFHSIYEPEGTEIVSYSGVPYNHPVRDLNYEETQKNKLAHLQTRLQNADWSTQINYETRIKYGLTKNTIAEMIQEEQADMVVLGNEGAEGLKEILVGSVAADVIQKATCPVLIIPPRATFKPLSKIVFATDLRGEPFADVNFVLRLAGLFDAEIIFLHIQTQNSTEVKEEVAAELTKIHKTLPYQNSSFYNEINAHIEDGISQFCRKHKADMLVMGYHPRTFWQNLFTQDYTQDMAYHTYLPLLVIHYRN
jgi:nucleotide-binding universal stress UspA family protein